MLKMTQDISMIEFGKWYKAKNEAESLLFFCIHNGRVSYLSGQSDGKAYISVLGMNKERVEFDIERGELVLIESVKSINGLDSKIRIETLNHNIQYRIKELIKECFNDE